MRLSWKDFLLLHAPHLIFLGIIIFGGIYTFAFEQGKRSIVEVSARAVHEAKVG